MLTRLNLEGKIHLETPLQRVFFPKNIKVSFRNFSRKISWNVSLSISHSFFPYFFKLFFFPRLLKILSDSGFFFVDLPGFLSSDRFPIEFLWGTCRCSFQNYRFSRYCSQSSSCDSSCILYKHFCVFYQDSSRDTRVHQYITDVVAEFLSGYFLKIFRDSFRCSGQFFLGFLIELLPGFLKEFLTISLQDFLPGLLPWFLQEMSISSWISAGIFPKVSCRISFEASPAISLENFSQKISLSVGSSMSLRVFLNFPFSFS